MRRLLVGALAGAALAAALLSPAVRAGVVNPLGVRLLNEGSLVGFAPTLDCVGAGVNCTYSSGTGTLTISGGSGTFAVTEVEIDFDTCGLGDAVGSYICSTTVTDAAVSGTSKIIVSQSGNTPTGKQADDLEMDAISCSAQAGSGQFTLRCFSLEGAVHGKFKVVYSVG